MDKWPKGKDPPPLSECGGVPVCGRDVGQVVFVSLFIVFISF